MPSVSHVGERIRPVGVFSGEMGAGTLQPNLHSGPWSCLLGRVISSPRQDGDSHSVVVWTQCCLPSLSVGPRPPHGPSLSLPCSYGGGSFSFSNLIRGVTRRFSTEYELKQVRSPGLWGATPV